MPANRISGYFKATTNRSPSQAVAPRPSSAPPTGFVALPAGFASSSSAVYQQAYLLARASAREKLLALLRSRSGLN